MRIALLVNIPAPYRVPVYDRMARAMGRDFRVIYMAAIENDRKWHVPPLEHAHTFLRGPRIVARGREIHLRIGVSKELRSFRPDVILTGGFNPPMIEAWLFAKATRRAHVPVSDAWSGSEAHLSKTHRLIRRAVFSTSSAFIGASHKTLDLYRSYGVRDRLFLAPLGVDNEQFSRSAGPLEDRQYDLVFAGNLIDRKLPLFFADVAERVAHLRSHCSVLVIGDGPMRDDMERALRAVPNLRSTFTGFLQQEQLPNAYAMGRIFCFPTRNDPWGVVANEACAAGMPVVTCDNAGCAGELVVHGRNGYVLELDAAQWATHIDVLLSRPELLAEQGRASQLVVASYNYDQAAEGMLDGCRSAVNLT